MFHVLLALSLVACLLYGVSRFRRSNPANPVPVASAGSVQPAKQEQK